MQRSILDSPIGSTTQSLIADPVAGVRDLTADATAPAPTIREILQMSPDEFQGRPDAQQMLFDGAGLATRRFASVGAGAIRAAGARGSAISVRKRDTLDGFVAGVLEKCRRKGYGRIGEMPDIVRGRFNLASERDVDSVVRLLQSNFGGFVAREVTAPRRENIQLTDPIGDAPADGFVGWGYPRFHVLVTDPVTGLVHEWQVGTTAVTRVFEQEGIDLPSGVTLPPGGRRDLHDIEYDIFQPMYSRHDRWPPTGESYHDIAIRYGVPAFSRSVDLLAAEAGRRGDEWLDRPDGQLRPEVQRRLSHLHERASDILRRLMNAYGPGFINGLMH